MKNFFGNIKWSQILAGALAAVTSFLFMNKIGIAGSVIGAAVASIVTALATQVYQDVLKASHDTMQKITGADGDSTDSQSDGSQGDGKAQRKPRAAVAVVDPYGKQMQDRLAQDDDLAGGLGAAAVASSVGGAADDAASGATGAGADQSASDGSGIKDEDFAGFTSVTETAPTQILPDAVRDAAVKATLDAEPSPMQLRREISSGQGTGSAKSGKGGAAGRKQLSPKARMFIVALVCSLIAVVITVVIISAVTGGEGLGTKPADMQQQIQTPYQDSPSTDEQQSNTPLDDETSTDDSLNDTDSTDDADSYPTQDQSPSETASKSATASPSVTASSSATQEETKNPEASASASPSQSSSPSASASSSPSAPASSNATASSTTGTSTD
ncbi:hypothetical protein [Pseudoscardovia suis]